MRKILGLLLLGTILVSSCRKEVIPMGDLRITVEWDGVTEPDTEVWLYDSWDNFNNYTFLENNFTDDFGQITFLDLDPGWYYLESEKIKSSMLTLYSVDSVEVIDGRMVNKLIILEPDNR